MFKISDCINVLNSILVIDEPKWKPANNGRYYHPKFGALPTGAPTIPGGVSVVPFMEIYPMDRDPYWDIAYVPPQEPPEPDEVPAPENLNWVSQWGEDDDEDSASERLRQAVRTALAKLEFTRQWIGRIRKQIAYYRGLPIEKFAPEHDEVQNPFGEPIKPKPLADWDNSF
jgi:hypothetical protein